MLISLPNKTETINFLKENGKKVPSLIFCFVLSTGLLQLAAITIVLFSRKSDDCDIFSTLVADLINDMEFYQHPGKENLENFIKNKNNLAKNQFISINSEGFELFKSIEKKTYVSLPYQKILNSLVLTDTNDNDYKIIYKKLVPKDIENKTYLYLFLITIFILEYFIFLAIIFKFNYGRNIFKIDNIKELFSLKYLIFYLLFLLAGYFGNHLELCQKIQKIMSKQSQTANKRFFSTEKIHKIFLGELESLNL